MSGREPQGPKVATKREISGFQSEFCNSGVGEENTLKYVKATVVFGLRGEILLHRLRFLSPGVGLGPFLSPWLRDWSLLGSTCTTSIITLLPMLCGVGHSTSLGRRRIDERRRRVKNLLPLAI